MPKKEDDVLKTPYPYAMKPVTHLPKNYCRVSSVGIDPGHLSIPVEVF
jgi:hypothetical protein